MNAKTLAELALKVWGVIQIISAIASLPTTIWISFVQYGPEWPETAVRATQIAGVIGVLMQLVVGIVVVVWADNIVALFEDDAAPLQIDADASELEMLALAIVGVVFLVFGLENVAGAGYTLWKKPSSDQTDMWTFVWQRQSEAIVRAVVEIAAGALLVFGRAAIARTWSRMRGQSLDDEQGEEQ